MHDDFAITELPEEYYDKEKSQDAAEKAIRMMVEKHPAMFAGERWDKYREEKQEKNENAII